MDILYLLVPLSVVLVFAIGLVFWFALRSGQFDDLDGPAFTVLADDDRPENANGGKRRPDLDAPAAPPRDAASDAAIQR